MASGGFFFFFLENKKWVGRGKLPAIFLFLRKSFSSNFLLLRKDCLFTKRCTSFWVSQTVVPQILKPERSLFQKGRAIPTGLQCSYIPTKH